MGMKKVQTWRVDFNLNTHDGARGVERTVFVGATSAPDAMDAAIRLVREDPQYSAPTSREVTNVTREHFVFVPE